MFNHPTHSLYVDDFTENSLFPGTPNVDAAEVDSMLANANYRTVVMNDMSSIFSQRSEKIVKFIGQLTTAFGGDYYKHSPGSGIVHYETHFNLVMGMTYKIIRKHRKYMNDIGNRMLIEHIPRGGNHVFRKADRKFDKNELRLQVCGLVDILKRRPLPKITDEVSNALHSFVEITVVLRTFVWARKWDEVEGITRLYIQLSYLIRSRARLHERDTNLDDIVFFKPLAWHTIGYENHIETIFNCCSLKGADSKGYLNKMVKAGQYLEIISKCIDDPEEITYSFIPEYQDYLEPMFALKNKDAPTSLKKPARMNDQDVEYSINLYEEGGSDDE